MVHGDFANGAQQVAANAASSAPHPGEPDTRVESQQGATVLLGDSAAMLGLFAQLQRVAPTSSSVLLIGEKGTGKQLVARYLHDASPRAQEPFVVVDCTAVAPDELAMELFGAERQGGNGSGQAIQQLHGRIERAGGGTILLEEITRLPLDLQVKLLDALESGYLPVASAAPHAQSGGAELRCRVLATTTVDAQQAVEEGRLRADLLYRLAVFPIVVPPLRQREGDVELLAHACLGALNAAENTSKRFSADSLVCLRQYTWPGNVWELRNVVHRAFILADEELELRPVTGKPLVPSANSDEQALRIPVGTNLAEAERWMIIATLKKCGGNKTRAAALLGVSLKTLYNRLNTYRAQGQDLGDIDGELTEVAV